MDDYTVDERRLKKCPWCGWTVEITTSPPLACLPQVYCGTCAFTSREFLTPDLAVEWWNGRAGDG